MADASLQARRSACGGRRTPCFAENEAGHPWELLHVERGYRPEQSAVTVYVSNSVCQVYNQLAAEPEPLLSCFAGALRNFGTPNLRGFNQSLGVFAGEHADTLRRSGWSKGDVRRFLMEHARRTVPDVKSNNPGYRAVTGLEFLSFSDTGFFRLLNTPPRVSGR